jgi:hypothetical protein
MPNNFDFKNIKNIKTIRIYPSGWINPLYVEYGICDDTDVKGIPSYCWRVEGILGKNIFRGKKQNLSDGPTNIDSSTKNSSSYEVEIKKIKKIVIKIKEK